LGQSYKCTGGACVGFGRLFGADWEEKKIREVMEESSQDEVG
jgi:hypothetical protein